MKRSQFIKTVGLCSVGVPIFRHIQTDPELPLERSLVQEFVGAGHRDMNKVREMLEANPTLLNAAHDWGRGDFETVLGAAQHVGYKELVTYLISKGAQTNIFTACLFGHLKIVKTILENFPGTLHSKGPHGFTLLHHALEGGEEGLEVKAFLESLGAVERKIPLY